MTQITVDFAAAPQITRGPNKKREGDSIKIQAQRLGTRGPYLLVV